MVIYNSDGIRNRMGVCRSTLRPSVCVVSPSNRVRSIWDIYEDVKVLGEGGFGTTHKAKHVESGQIHALKLIPKKNIHKNTLADPKKPFIREVEILQSVQHKGICTFIDAFEDDAYLIIVLEYLSGGELFDRILQMNHYSEKVASTMVSQMLEIILYLHSNDIVHLDIKPENFVLALPENDDSIKLIDFGLALKVEEGRNDYPACGTKIYKSPEMRDPLHYRDKEVLKLADCYSFGVLMFTMLIGRFPGFNRKREIVFPEGCKLSEGAMDLMQKLCRRNFRDRISIGEALKHPWVVGTQVPDIPLKKEVLLGIKHFQFVSMFQKAMLGIMADSLSSEDTEKLALAFDALDEDKNGCLDVKELSHLLYMYKHELGLADEAEAAQRAMKILEEVDADKNGTIDRHEWLQIQLIGSLMKKSSEITMNIEALFKLLDEDGDGRITVDELSKFLVNHNSAEIQQMFTEADENNDGVIEFYEFLNAMKLMNGSVISTRTASLSKIFQQLSNKSYKQLLDT